MHTRMQAVTGYVGLALLQQGSKIPAVGEACIKYLTESLKYFGAKRLNGDAVMKHLLSSAGVGSPKINVSWWLIGWCGGSPSKLSLGFRSGKLLLNALVWWRSRWDQRCCGWWKLQAPRRG